MRYSSRQGRWIGRGRTNVPTGPDPYSPDSPGYADRNRETVTKLPGGMVRIDLGDPIGAPKRKPKSQRPASAAPVAEPTPRARPPAPPAAVNGGLKEKRARFRLSPTLGS